MSRILGVVSVLWLLGCTDNREITALESGADSAAHSPAALSPDSSSPGFASTPGCTGILIAPGDDWSAKIAAASAGATFCVKDGVHTKARNLMPKSGQRFIGQSYLGATLTGGDTVRQAFGGSASNVVIRYLRIEHYKPADGGRAMIHGDNGRFWVVDSNEIAFSKGAQGVRVGDRGHLCWNRIHDNGIIGIGLYYVDSVMVCGNYLARNPPTFVDESGMTARSSQMKIFATVGTVVRGNVLEDGKKKGIWFDTDNYKAVIDFNTIRRQGQAGIWYEASYDGKISDNTVAGCGSATTATWVENAGIQVTNSQVVEISGNKVSGCDNGITGMSVAAASSHHYSTGSRGRKALGMDVHDNWVTQVTGRSGVRATGAADSVFRNGKIHYQSNTYDLSTNATPFTWQNSDKTSAQWRAFGFDRYSDFAP